MNLFVNDLSLKCSLPLQEHWEFITEFGRLVNKLKEFDIDKISFPKGYKNMSIGGIYWKDCYIKESCPLKDDQRMELLSLMSSSIYEVKESDIDFNHIFSEDASFDVHSSFLGNSFTMDNPVVSFTFKDIYKKQSIAGYYKKLPTNHSKRAEVRNLYDAASISPLSTVSFKKCKTIKPENFPLWNSPDTIRYIRKIGHKDDITFTTTEEKQAYLIKHGTVIALLNGWKEDTIRTNKNRSPQKIRKIFYSAKFKQTDTYLCIDMEHPDIRFELCNHRGIHLKEIKYTGETTGSAKTDHNIKV